MTKNHTVTPYLFLAGRCGEAIEFYRQAVGAESLMIVRYENAPPEVKSQMPCPPNWIMHARLRIGVSTVMLADGPATGKSRRLRAYFDRRSLRWKPNNFSPLCPARRQSGNAARENLFLTLLRHVD